MRKLLSVKTILFDLQIMFEKAIDYVELSLLFALSEYNGGGLMRRVMVGRVDGRGKGYGCVFPWRRTNLFLFVILFIFY